MNQRYMKHIVYKYDDRSDEMEVDPRGLLTFTKDDIVFRHGTSWKIELAEQQGADDREQIPILWVYLTGVMVN